jgi:hypothetical protein
VECQVSYNDSSVSIYLPDHFDVERAIMVSGIVPESPRFIVFNDSLLFPHSPQALRHFKWGILTVHDFQDLYLKIISLRGLNWTLRFHPHSTCTDFVVRLHNLPELKDATLLRIQFGERDVGKDDYLFRFVPFLETQMEETCPIFILYATFEYTLICYPPNPSLRTARFEDNISLWKCAEILAKIVNRECLFLDEDG